MHLQGLLTNATYVGIIGLFVFVAVRAVRRHARADIDASLFFGALAGISVIGLVFGPSRPDQPFLVHFARSVMALALPLLLIRLLEGFTAVSTRTRRLFQIGFVVSILEAAFLSDWPWLAIPAMYFLVCLAYLAVHFVRFAATSTGVTRRRMQSIGIGTGAFVGAGVIAVVARVFPEARPLFDSILAVFGVSTCLGYLFAFAPPAFVRRIWQYSALTELIGLVARTPASLPLAESLPLLNLGVASALGVPSASIGLWNEEHQVLLPPGMSLEDVPDYDPEQALITRVYRAQQAQFFDDAAKADPANAALYGRAGATSIVVAPVSTATRQFGVLTLYSARASLLSAHDLPIAQSIADQIAAFLQRSELVQQAVRLEAQASTVQLKEDFLAAAAHDLRTPLTGILGRAQLMLRRAQRTTGAFGADELEALVADSRRMQQLTEDLLEVSRPDNARFSRDRTITDLRALVISVLDGMSTHGHPVRVDGHAVAFVDAGRIRQVLQRLLDNAVKFSRDSGEIAIRLQSQAGRVRLILDVEMPGMDGFAVARAVRLLHHLDAMPILALTGMTGPDDAVHILQAGADAYRSKPVDIAELRRLVASLLVEGR